MPTEAASTSAPNPGATLSKAVIRAGRQLGLTQRELAEILGMSAANASRLYGAKYVLDPKKRKEWELALLFVRLFRSLDAILGHGDEARRWLEGHNLGLTGRPVDLIKTTEGLVRVVAYLDAYRGRI